MNEIYDLIIIGAGPAGFAASIYAARYKLNHLIFGTTAGGQISEIHNLENYPGILKISGAELIAKLNEQIENLGVRLTKESVSAITKNGDVFTVETTGKKYQSRAIILAMGTEYKKINIPGEKEFTGRGVSYCPTCDAFFFRNKTVCVLGGANSAASAALELAEVAEKVYMIFRRDKMTAEPMWVEKIMNHSKIELVSGTNVIEIKGDKKVEKVILDKAKGDQNHLDVDGVFVEVGSDPGAALATKLGVKTDEDNYIIVNPDMSTNIPGIYAAGDITTGSNKFRQIVTATAEGAIAAASVYKLLKLK
ncbi:MAG: FAD-dependent oxidoreductase [Parcubacteria group bacterium]|jgi:thioredoxin-disulfide reductase